ncbi:YugN-like family protein [Brevibacillus humidisoli]|uniref:YugN family protein n=1 Tax=Brevibacillus humidisoli TaxID=2895522 RepID=UPI001E60A2A3|nr:YugN family protein [Brevibacillus humidisoli]UFJ42961.1 YugN-like family protein [Brevibacillus humidisoli]
MVIADTGIANAEIHLAELDHMMKELGFVRWAWDYQHATYDFKIEEKEDVYFVRVQADATEGALEDPDTLLKLGEPYIGKHLFPHGLDYEAPVPDKVMTAAKQALSRLKQKLSAH